MGLLGTGTDYQYNLLLKFKCNGYILCLDPDDAGRNGILKLGTLLFKKHKVVYVVDMPEGKDVNDLLKEQFDNITLLSFQEWKQRYKS